MDVPYSSLQDELLLLQAAGTFTATGNGAALDLGAAFAPGGGGLPCQCAVQVTAIDTTDGNETYKFKLQDSPDNAAWTDRTPDTAATAVGACVVQGFIVQRYVRLVRTLAGTTPSITIGNAYLNPLTVD